MYWTEEEAKKKWCPQGQIDSLELPLDATLRTGQLNKKCIASECMMWREEEGTPRGMLVKGYCGLAGKP